jgi:glutaryl-CoA dehydrogenase
MVDFLQLDALLQPEEQQICLQVRQFVEREAEPLLVDAYETGRFPAELIPKMAQLGFLGMTLPKKYGGRAANYVSYGLTCQELEKGDSGLRSFVSVQSSLCMFPIFTFGTEEQKKNFLPAMAAGKVIACFGLTEPQGGSDPMSMLTQAEKVAGGWRLNGQKRWLTNGPIADIAIIWAKTAEGIRGFIVDAKTSGFHMSRIEKKLSLRASESGELILENCFVPDDNYLPGTERGLSAALQCLNQARYGIAWGAIGAAIACYETALHYCKQRVQFGKPIAAFQLVQKDLVQMLTEITKSQCFNLQLGRLKDQNQASPEMISMAKMNACYEALKIARSARNLLAANGITSEYPVMRHLANLESVFTYEGTDNVQHLILGKYITGMNAFV